MAYRKKTSQGITVSLKEHPEYGKDTEPPEVVARRTSLEEYLQLRGYTDTPEGDDRSHTVRQLERFAESLISWNIAEEDGTPTPPTRDEFFKLDEDLALALATEWIERIGGKVYGPLPQSSPDGEPSLEASIPMEPLSDLPLPTSVPA
jgi:hypothetical protein